MKSLLTALFLCAASVAPAATPAGVADEKFGVGGVLGVPFGLTAKYLISDLYAVQSHLGISDGDLTVSADFLKNYNDKLPRKKPGMRIPLYAGLGLKVKAEESTFVGIRFVGGVSLFDSRRPIEFFAEVAPVLRIAPSEGGAFDGAVGLRRYF